MQVKTLPGIQSTKFLDINTLEHRFPEKLKNIGFPVTLLHNHPHCPTDYVLVYEDNFTKSTYKPRKEAETKYYACSWFLENGSIIAFEFCDELLPQ